MLLRSRPYNLIWLHTSRYCTSRHVLGQNFIQQINVVKCVGMAKTPLSFVRAIVKTFNLRQVKNVQKLLETLQLFHPMKRKKLNSGDLITGHSVNGNIRLTDFTVAGSLPDKIYGHLNSGQIVRYSDHHPNSGQIVRYSDARYQSAIQITI